LTSRSTEPMRTYPFFVPAVAALLTGGLASVVMTRPAEIYPAFTSASATDETLYLVSRNGASLWAIARRSGELEWRYKGAVLVNEPPIIVKPWAIIADGDVLRWIDLQSGRQVRETGPVWTFQWWGPLLLRGAVLVRTPHGPLYPSWEGVAGLSSDGETMWTRENMVALPGVKSYLAAVGPADRSHLALRRLNPETGEDVWVHLLPSASGIYLKEQMEQVRQILDVPGGNLLVLWNDLERDTSDPYKLKTTGLKVLSVHPKEGLVRPNIQANQSISRVDADALLDAQLVVADERAYLAEVRGEGGAPAAVRISSVDPASGLITHQGTTPLSKSQPSMQPKVAGLAEPRGESQERVLVLYAPKGCIVWGVGLETKQVKWVWESEVTEKHEIAVMVVGHQVVVGEARQAIPGDFTSWQRLAVCLDAATGTKMWEYLDDERVPAQREGPFPLLLVSSLISHWSVGGGLLRR